MVLDMSDLEPGCCQTRDLPAPSGNNGQDEMGYTMRKKHQYPGTEEDHQDNIELERNKKAKKNNPETEVDSSSSSSSSSDHSCFVALVTASNLHKDALDLPKEFTSSNLLERECRKIVLRDRWERSWALDLAFNKSSDTFYIRQGWRSFCDENGKKAGSLFVFKLDGNRETPLLSLCSTESISNKNNKESCMEHSTTPIKSRSVTLTIDHDSFRRGSQRLPLRFMREHGLDKSRLITLLGKDGTKWVANLRRESTRGRMRLGKGWKDFVLANSLKVGDSFTLELVGKDNTPMLSLVGTESTSDKMHQGKFVSTKPESGNKKRKAKNHREEGNKCLPNRKDSLSPDQNRFLTLTLTHDSINQQYLPSWFASKNGLSKPGMITLLGKDGTKWVAKLLPEHRSRGVRIGKGWRHFAVANGLKSGKSFTLESVWENETPILSLFSTESTSESRQQGECSEGREKEYFSTQPSSGNMTRAATNNIEEMRDSSSAIKKQLVTLTLTPEDVRDCKLILPSQFMKANGITKLGKITFMGRNRTTWLGYLLSKDGVVALGCGWNGFCEANDVKIGESFTLELIDEQETNTLVKFCSNSNV